MGMPDAEGHGPPDGLPDLPPEWGRVVVPDDASALAEEARQVRRELRAARRQATVRPRLGPGGRPSPGLPVLLLLVAVLITLTGLAAVTWPRSNRSGGAPTVLPYPTAPVGPLPALDLVGPDDAPVPLRSMLPAMIILVDACVCAEEVGTAAATAPPGVTVVTVTGSRDAEAATTPGVRPLADPAGGLRSYVHLSAHPGTAAALLVDRQGTLVRVVPELGPAADYRDDLVRLAG
ncbi:hypothetical protein GCM10010169_54330 [Micromonospora fulviviridis]|uniref:hypothetical protein n=1 Tax=Micromonospora fulviviridis TaxID=47860 RepID=UPI0016696358|nr:hypothetical protein [Micromonospora fulviviridis]GGS02764.1 hypothetical protein GCM10010169_54330 [Micromonospora fulviviridis]